MAHCFVIALYDIWDMKSHQINNAWNVFFDSKGLCIDTVTAVTISRGHYIIYFIIPWQNKSTPKNPSDGIISRSCSNYVIRKRSFQKKFGHPNPHYKDRLI